MATLVVPSAVRCAPDRVLDALERGQRPPGVRHPLRGTRRRALSRLRPNRAFVSPSPGSATSADGGASHPTEPTGAERATRVVLAAKDNAKDRPTPRMSPRSTEAGL